MRRRLRTWTVPVSSAWEVWLWLVGAVIVTAIGVFHLFLGDYGDAFQALTWSILAGLYAAEQHSRRVEHGAAAGPGA